MYVRNSNHIKGHILICVIALGILKLLQWKLKEAGTPLSISEIVRALNSATTVPIKSANELMFLQCSRPQNIRKGSERLTQEELKAELSGRRQQPSQLENGRTRTAGSLSQYQRNGSLFRSKTYSGGLDTGIAQRYALAYLQDNNFKKLSTP